jgi:hypothetical protein
MYSGWGPRLAVYVVRQRALKMTWRLHAKCASAGCAARDGIPSNQAPSSAIEPALARVSGYACYSSSSQVCVGVVGAFARRRCGERLAECVVIDDCGSRLAIGATSVSALVASEVAPAGKATRGLGPGELVKRDALRPERDQFDAWVSVPGDLQANQRSHHRGTVGPTASGCWAVVRRDVR